MVDTSDLNPTAKAAAERAVAGGLVLTSGRRSVQQQAHAMATNVVLKHDWIGKTYAANAVSEACQKWVNDNRQAASKVDTCSQGLLSVLDSFDDKDLRHLSWHLSGDAFDCDPDGDDDHLKLLHHILAECVAAGAEGTLLTEEGGLVRWHVQVAGGTPIHAAAAAPAAAAEHSAGPLSALDDIVAHAAQAAEHPQPAEHHQAEHHQAEHHSVAFPGTMLHEGVCSEEVKTWQEQLIALGHSVSADGEFGPKTEEATKEFQNSKGLVADGIVGEHTWSAAFA
jgi:hypothetical protein